MQHFLTLAGSGDSASRVRGSRFLSLAFSATSEVDVRSVIEERRSAYFDASHHCAAWRFRDGRWRALDSGEPSGSAGAPILAAIDGLEVVDTAVVVTRFFGGVKLGVGGLARAYGEAAAAALAAAPMRRGIPAKRVRIRYSHELTGPVMRAIERGAAADVEHGFTPNSGAPEVSFTIPSAGLAGVRDFLRDESAGALTAEIQTDTVLYVPIPARRREDG